MIPNNYSLPNFLIVGAAKAGTTSLANYLKQHSEIFFPKIKEPKYFLSQHKPLPIGGQGGSQAEKRMVNTFEEYKKLYVTEKNYRLKGDASVDNLFYYKESIPLIKNTLGDVKIIIMLRNPVNRAISAYKHIVKAGYTRETIHEILKSENEFITNNYMPIWYLKDVGLYSKQVKAYLDNFTHVKIIIFEEFINDLRVTLNETFRFLGVGNEPVDISKVYNKTYMPNNYYLNYFLKRTKLINRLKKTGKFIGIEKGIVKAINKLSKNNEGKLQISKDTIIQLKNYYSTDVIMLESIINKALTVWK